MAKTAIST